MTTADDFLRAIIASPADDGPRLIFADWLEEAGTDTVRSDEGSQNRRTALRESVAMPVL